MAEGAVQVYLPNSYMQSEEGAQGEAEDTYYIAISFRNSLPIMSGSWKHEGCCG